MSTLLLLLPIVAVAVVVIASRALIRDMDDFKTRVDVDRKRYLQ